MLPPPSAAGREADDGLAPLGRILAEVARRRGIDFRDYRPQSIRRGIRARMEERDEPCLQRYARCLDDEAEVTRLIEAMVVPWSCFFRDPLVFQALGQRVLPALAVQHLERRPLRAWCVGAATGEEAWSLAMLMAESFDLPGGPAWQLFATDIDHRTLAIGEAASYPLSSVAPVPEHHRRRFLREGGERATLVPELRRHLHFAYHDLLGPTLAPAAAVVAAFELVLVRNVLIYFDRRLQEKALARLAAVLQPGAVLVLGEVETLPPLLADQLAPFPGLDPALRIFVAKAT